MFHGASWLYNRYRFYGVGGLDSFFDQTPLPLSKNPPMPNPCNPTESAQEFDSSTPNDRIVSVRGKDAPHLRLASEPYTVFLLRSQQVVLLSTKLSETLKNLT